MTDETDLPASLRDFLRENVESYEQLEILLLLGRSPKLAWRLAGIAQKAQLSESAAEDALRHLCSKRLASSAPDGVETFYYYSPTSAGAAEAVGSLVEMYEARPLPLMRVMTANSIERMRANAAGAFDVLLTSRKKDDS